MKTDDVVEPRARPSDDWDDLRQRLRRRATEAIDLISILIQDSVILVAGFLAELAYARWLHTTQPFFQFATTLSSALFLLLYGVTVTVHIVSYIRGQFGPTQASRFGRYLPWVVAVSAIVGAAILAAVPMLRNAPGAGGDTFAPRSAAVARFSILPPQGRTFDPGRFNSPSPAISPDGRYIVFTTLNGATPELWVRTLDTGTDQLIGQTIGSGFSFWSTGSDYIGFVAGNKLMKVAVRGGPVQPLSDLPANLFGGTWNHDGTILIGMLGHPIHRISAAGGELVPLTTLDASLAHTGHYQPSFLPDGRHFLFTVASNNPANNGIFVGSLDGDQPRLLIGAVTSAAKYSPTGHLLFVRDQVLMAQSFDTGRLELHGEPFRVADVAVNDISGGAPFAVSENGILVFRSSGSDRSRLVWFDRAGKALEAATEPGLYANPALSPDGSKIAFDRATTNGRADIWLHDIARNLTSRLTFHNVNTAGPAWTPDGKSIVFRSNKGGEMALYRVGVGTSGDEAVLMRSEVNLYPDSFTPDGNTLVYVTTAGSRDIFALSLTGTKEPVQITNTPFIEGFPRLSPDGRWLAYVSNESGREEIYVQSFPNPRMRQQVSGAGGSEPLWNRNGTELYYVTADGTLMSVSVKTTAVDLELGRSVALFTAAVFGRPGSTQQFAVSPQGRFLVNVLATSGAEPLTVVLNWGATLPANAGTEP